MKFHYLGLVRVNDPYRSAFYIMPGAFVFKINYLKLKMGKACLNGGHPLGKTYSGIESENMAAPLC